MFKPPSSDEVAQMIAHNNQRIAYILQEAHVCSENEAAEKRRCEDQEASAWLTENFIAEPTRFRPDGSYHHDVPVFAKDIYEFNRKVDAINRVLGVNGWSACISAPVEKIWDMEWTGEKLMPSPTGTWKMIAKRYTKREHK